MAQRASTKNRIKKGNSQKCGFFYVLEYPDHLGSSSYITNLDGEVVQHVEYVPFGEVFLEEKNAVWNTPYLFNGKELDKETGLNYFSARYQDPKTGIFISVDPLAEHSPNKTPYHYCSNNPINRTDPTGMCDDPNCTHGAIRRGWDAIGRFFGAWGHSENATAKQSNVTAGPIEKIDPQSPEEQEKYAQDLRNLSEIFSYERLESALEIIIIIETIGLSRGVGTNTSTVSTKTSSEPIKTNKTTTQSSNPDFIVTEQGVAIPQAGGKYNIDKKLIENPHSPPGTTSYGNIENGKFKETLRIDPATPAGKKGPNYSHYHINGKGKHYSPNGKDKNPGF